MPMNSGLRDSLEDMQKALTDSDLELVKQGRDDEMSLLMRAMILLIENELRKDKEERRKNFGGQ